MFTQKTAKRINTSFFMIAALYMFGLLLPYAISKPKVEDFAQLYMGAVMIQQNQPQHLYPIPIPNDKQLNAGFYRGSHMNPQYKKLAAERNVADNNRYIYPPPVAVLALPFAYLSYPSARFVFQILLCIAAFLTAYYSAMIYQSISRDNPSPKNRWLSTLHQLAPGLLCFILATSPLMLRGVRVGNVSLLIACLITLIFYLYLQNRRVTAAILIPLAGVAKATSLPFILLAIPLKHFRLILISGIVTVLILIATYPMLGSEPYHIFFKQITPTLMEAATIIQNHSVVNTIKKWAGLPSLPSSALTIITAIEWAIIFVTMAYIYKYRSKIRSSPLMIACAATILLNLHLIFRPLLWEHYAIISASSWALCAYYFIHTGSHMFRILCILPPIIHWLPIVIVYRGRFAFYEPIHSQMLWGHLIIILIATIGLRMGTRSIDKNDVSEKKQARAY
ncbi:hypothetical protein KS4_25400 [Poriferisphaera corsica]|uniref:DUF2029 domain-containing protein n=1 Tax=Poriferisphaera corsica TaxID=2528020 RepID=A0A517YW63_9BACT|nr:glycosyltransferase family 87 protein [Poriferisphaera corsica]QDU34470.1 hypothetical protein KS4_25400 [Poriferisphaera corsica]